MTSELEEELARQIDRTAESVEIFEAEPLHLTVPDPNAPMDTEWWSSGARGLNVNDVNIPAGQNAVVTYQAEFNDNEMVVAGAVLIPAPGRNFPSSGIETSTNLYNVQFTANQVVVGISAAIAETPDTSWDDGDGSDYPIQDWLVGVVIYARDGQGFLYSTNSYIFPYDDSSS